MKTWKKIMLSLLIVFCIYILLLNPITMHIVFAITPIAAIIGIIWAARKLSKKK